jgi:gamma-glutamyl-gamma-aminobutyrate hydrolase PuuD
MRVGISQRVDYVSERNEWRDALEQSWTIFFEHCGFELIPIPNMLSDPGAYISRCGIDAIVLSGGGDIGTEWKTIDEKSPRLASPISMVARDRDLLESNLLELSIKNGMPIIGVCRGMQFMNLYHGGALIKVQGHVGQAHHVDILDESFPCDEMVNSFHDFGVPVRLLGEKLAPKVITNGLVEAFLHAEYPHLGIMWHPERCNEASSNDISLFRKFLESGSLS